MKSLPVDFEKLRAHVEALRPSVKGNPRRAQALEGFRRIYGIPDTRIMDHFAEHGRSLVRADAALFGHLDEDGMRWHGAAGCTMPASFPRGEFLAEWALVARTPLLFDDATELPVEFVDAKAMGWRSVAAMPVLNEGIAVGALVVGRVARMPWAQDEAHALDAWMAMNAILNDRRNELMTAARHERVVADTRFGAIYERAPMGIVLVDEMGKFEAVNAAFAELCGVTRESLVGKHVRDVAIPLENDPSATYLSEMLAGKRRAYTAERKVYRPDGGVRLVRVTTAQLRFTEDSPISHLAICEDVTDQRTAEHALREREEQLRHAQKMEAIGQLAGGLAHDFSNTLASISGFASLLRDDTRADDPRRNDIDGILRATQRASSITRRLLTISKKQVQERATLDLKDVLQEFGTLVRPVLPTSIEYSLDLPGPSVYATIDRMQIEQALLNLALNARDAMPRGGALSIELDVVSRALEGAAATGFARISVRDTGTGIRPEVFARLWEPFFTTKSRGSGLGLPMSRAILREHGGDLQADPHANAGASFSMLLPLAATGTAPMRDAVTPGISLAGAPTGQTVLLADDEEAVRVTSRRLLERAGFTVLVASQGGEALRIFLANIGTVDILVTDLMMPELSGRELVRRVRANIADMPVVITSAYPPDDEPGMNTTGEHQIVNATLVKPFTGSVLVQTVREVLAKHRRSDRAGPAIPTSLPQR